MINKAKTKRFIMIVVMVEIALAFFLSISLSPKLSSNKIAYAKAYITPTPSVTTNHASKLSSNTHKLNDQASNGNDTTTIDLIKLIITVILGSGGILALIIALINNKHSKDMLLMQQEHEIKLERIRERKDDPITQGFTKVQTELSYLSTLSRKLQTVHVLFPDELFYTLNMENEFIIDAWVYEHVYSSYALESKGFIIQKLRDPDILQFIALRLFWEPTSIRIASELSEIIDFSKKRCVVLGNIGSGKTLLLKSLALKIAKGELNNLSDLNLPIYIELKEFAHSRKVDILEFVIDGWKSYGFSNKIEAYTFINENVKAGKVMFLLDGLDESRIGRTKRASLRSFKRVIKAINELANDNQNTPIIVSSRKIEHISGLRLEGFTEWKIEDFRSEDILAYINEWFQHNPRSLIHLNAKNLTKLLERNRRIQALATKPLLLLLVLILYKKEFPLVKRRNVLYEKCLDTLISEWNARKNIHFHYDKFIIVDNKPILFRAVWHLQNYLKIILRKLKPQSTVIYHFKLKHKDMRHLLEEVAWHFHNKGQCYFSEDDLLKVLGEFLPHVGLASKQKEQVLEEIVVQNGLLKKQGQASYSFFCLTVQEYLAAKYAVEYQKLDVLLTHCHETWWEEVILLYALGTTDASPLLENLEAMDNNSQDDIFHTALILAGNCLALEPKILQTEIGEKIVLRLLNLLMKSPYLFVQMRIAEILAQICQGKMSKEFLQPFVRKQVNQEGFQQTEDPLKSALDVLGNHYIPCIMLPLLCNQSICMRINDLDERDDNSKFSEIYNLLSNQQIDLTVRVRVAHALYALDESFATSRLLVLLRDEKLHPYIRWGIAHTLEVLREHSIIPELINLLQDSDIHPLVKWSLVNTLASIGGQSVVSQLQHLLSIEEIDQYVRWNIAITLDKLDALEEDSAVSILRSLSFDEKIDPIIRQSIAAILNMRKASIVAELINRLSDQQISQEMRMKIADVLGLLADDSMAIRELTNLLTNSDIPESIYRALWMVNRRARSTMF